MSVIFLAGVHGVGKGYLGAPVAQSLGISHFTASQLIREEKGRTTWGADKRVAELDDNQIALIRAITRRHTDTQDMLLDGHFVLRGSLGQLVPLGTQVFTSLRLSGAILLTEDAHTIASRLVERDEVAVNPDSIAKLADAEFSHAHEVCDALNVPLSVLHSTTIKIMTETVARLLKR